MVILLIIGILLFPVNVELIPSSPDGQLGLLLVITSIKMMALGETPYTLPKSPISPTIGRPIMDPSSSLICSSPLQILPFAL
ncbi:MAG: hypothetical protein GXY48_12360 [Methanomicrobiales archaeon]|nr:hypothetical protein [Methanomicrobiales archaeon]